MSWRNAARAFWLPAFVLCGAPALLLYRSLLCGETFVPADLLAYIAPWASGAPPTSGWNVLRFDGVTQFYPWRLMAARSLHAGLLPLWNAYSFGAAGGAPLLANSQSAPLYPLNALLYLLPLNHLWFGFALLALTHLAIAGAGVYCLLRALGIRRSAALTAAIAFMLSGPIVTWLTLPTFLSVACWLPWLLLAIRACFHAPSPLARRKALAGASAATGLMLLGGHLQIALYGLLLTSGYALTLGCIAVRARRLRPIPVCLTAGWALALGFMLSLPQLLPAVELSRISHRAAGNADYAGYLSLALPVRNLVTLLEPDFFGNPNPLGTPYWNTNNYAEWCLYAGAAPLLLALFAVGLPWRSLRAAPEAPGDLDRPILAPAAPPERAFFAAAGLLALLVALGTPLNAVLFYLLPGFSQTGNPARILVVFALCVSLLAGIGLHALLDPALPRAVKERAFLVGMGVPVLATAIGASQAAQFQQSLPGGMSLAALLEPVHVSLICGVIFTALTAALLFTAVRMGKASPAGQGFGAAFLLLTLLDLMRWALPYNPTAPAQHLYRVTPGIRYLMTNARPDDLIAPINRTWSLYKGLPPRNAVLVPNSLSVFGLHDLGGYDSLLPNADKEQVLDAGGEDPSPPENGNMVLIKRPETAMALGARFLVYAPTAVPDPLPAGLKSVYTGDDLAVLENRGAIRSFNRSASRSYRPVSFRFGLFAALCALAVLSAAHFAERRIPSASYDGKT